MERPDGADETGVGAGWALERTSAGIPLLRCAALREAGLLHAFVLRDPGSRAEPRDTRPLQGGAAHLGLSGVPIASPRQVHGAAVAMPRGDGGATEPESADAVIVTARPG